jgi:hypothetical protein
MNEGEWANLAGPAYLQPLERNPLPSRSGELASQQSVHLRRTPISECGECNVSPRGLCARGVARAWTYPQNLAAKS